MATTLVGVPQAYCQGYDGERHADWPSSDPGERVYGDEVEQKESEAPPPDRRRAEEEAARQRAEAEEAEPVVPVETEPYARFEFGARSGYAFPSGKIRGDAAEGIASVVAGQVPVWVDVGARFRGGLFFGAYGSYGFGVLSGDLTRVCDRARSAGAEVSCGASDVRVGLEVTYHVPLDKGISGWFGGALGWEWLSFEASETIEGQTQSLSVGANGMQPFMVQAGIDFEPAPGLGLGPFVAVTSDIYFTLRTQCQGDCGPLGSGTTTISDKTWHNWYFIGARVTWRP